MARVATFPSEDPVAASARAWSDLAPAPAPSAVSKAEKDYTEALFAGDELRMSELLRTSGESQRLF